METKTIRVLHVEDDPDDALLIRKALQYLPRGSFELRQADSLARAFEALADGRTDVLLLDLSLPGTVGLETLERARARAGLTPIVVMTGFDDETLSLQAVQQGAQDYLIKGRVTAESLARCLRHAVERTALDRLREDYLHNVNHEFRAPLSSVYAALLTLQEGAFGPLTPAQKPILELALHGVDHLVKMTEALADVLRTETGKLVLHPQRLPLADLVAETTELLGQSKPARGLSLSTEVPPEVPAVHADPVRVRQVLINLLANALRFTPSGGRVEVRARVWEKDPAFACLSVEDTGRGIAPEAVKRLFDRAHQAPAAEKGSRGLGLGLYLCRDIVTRHGGEIWVESAVGKGSAFHFTLPLSR